MKDGNDLENVDIPKFSKFTKLVVLLGYVGIDLLKYEQYNTAEEFLDFQSSNMLLPYIIQPGRMTSHSKFFIGDVFSNYISQEII